MYMRWVSALFLAVALSSPASARTLTVDQAVQLAVDHSLTIDAAEFGEQRAQAEATEALLQFFPRLSTTASYTRLDPVPYVEFDTSEFLGGGDTGGGCDNIDPETLPPGFTEEMARDFCEMMMGWFAMDTGDSAEAQRIEMGRADNWAVGGSLEQIVFAGGALHQSRAGSMDMLRASTEQVRLAKHQTAFDAEQGFYGLVAARRATEMTGEAVELVEAYVTDLRNLSEVGMASRADLMAAEVQLSQAKLDDLRMSHMARLAETAFRVSLGLPRGEELELQMDETIPVDDLPRDRDALVALALTRRPEVAAMNHTLDGLKHYSNAAWASWLPAVVVLGNLNAQNPDYSAQPEWMFTANVTAALSWSIWDRGAALQKNRAARASLHQLEAQRDLLAEMLDVEIEAALSSFDEAVLEREVARGGLEAAKESYRLEQERFQEGVANNTQLLQSHTELAGADMAVLQAETQMRISHAALRKAVGMEPEVTR